MKIPKVTDRRVRRTRDALRDALLKLILERGWDAVDVRDICERADVGRSTFYTHFADKEDLLLSGFDDLRKALKALRPAVAGSGKPLAFTRGLFDHAHANRWLFRALVGKRSGLAVQKRFRQLLLDLTEEELAGSIPAGPWFDAAVHYIAGGCWEFLTFWIDARNPMAPAELDDLFQRLTAKVLSPERLVSS